MNNIESIREDFPILHQSVNDELLIYLDNAATTQKPKAVLDAMRTYYETSNANVHRGVHTLAERATSQYEAARETVRSFIKAEKSSEIVFTRGTTASINMIARGFAEPLLQEGDEIALTIAEHHANFVPWQEVAKRTGAKLVFLPLLEDGTLNVDEVPNLLSERTKIVTIAHATNVLGTVNPIRELADLIHARGGYIVVDGAQSVAHQAIDVSELDADFFVFSGHKMCGPTGIGVLYGKQAVLEQLEPTEFGGEMIDFVGDESSTWKNVPWRLEAGTPPIAEAIGLAAAIDYLNEIGMDAIEKHVQSLIQLILPKMKRMDGVTVYGPENPVDRTGIISFNIEGIHPHDVATGFDMEGIAIRAGHHCAQPLHRHLGVQSSARASFYFYNTLEEAEHFVQTLETVKEFFQHGYLEP